ncbi:hypothetical protein [Lacticaseibacillus paracasei]|uniref:hypothetical protein n=1 Tax=Lacticaseibacillus paracasei TaxID=1597 RepID=UPI0007BED92C|nr:hypothetical protein [Lacticaseibacillus paracasei]MCP9309035.1 hypothetical protein [Lacticaseibacillus paracasei]MCP9345837.1 hypothetical protein [Lacticaseibacillus paracasei]MCP9365245.1 hypothetical protein [Lacticaseibacillus paracasei]MCP9377541.1 hypothetical protein [Lacticaseibacillus paracasei]QPB57108.1 hypothetical protein GFB64_08400 [Lacticaseibacillus paracasei]
MEIKHFDKGGTLDVCIFLIEQLDINNLITAFAGNTNKLQTTIKEKPSVDTCLSDAANMFSK